MLSRSTLLARCIPLSICCDRDYPNLVRQSAWSRFLQEELLYLKRHPVCRDLKRTWNGVQVCAWVPHVSHEWKPRKRRQCHCSAAGADKHSLVFLGTPEVAAGVLKKLLTASKLPDSSFEVAAVVSQPGRPKGRGSKKVAQPSPVEQLALDHGLSPTQISCPVKASEPEFLEWLTSIRPDLCVTAAYGNILPRAFLAIPKHGTLNVHPSLLPQYRGAAPVQRAIQEGCPVAGVSVAFTVRAMDAGPVLAQHSRPMPPDTQAPQLLAELFDAGTELLLERLPQVWSGEAATLATPQDEAESTHAPKLSKEEGVLDFSQPALHLHNKVRAFAGWPGTTAETEILGKDIDQASRESIKVLRTGLGSLEGEDSETGGLPRIEQHGKRLLVRCGRDGSSGGSLEILEVQPVGKKAMPASAFLNGLSGRTLRLARS